MDCYLFYLHLQFLMTVFFSRNEEADALKVVPSENREEGDENDRMSSCSDIMEVDVPRAPTPDIVDLLDSDDDDEAIMR